jgi:hypothetical protein
MNEEKAREILGDWIQSDNSLYCLGQYVFWDQGSETICLDDGRFKIPQLEAIVWWMKNYQEPDEVEL